MPTVLGLIPRAARLELEATQLPDLTSEVLTRIEALTTEMREVHERRARAAPETVANTLGWLTECNSILAALNVDHRPPGAGASVEMSFVVADDLVRACLKRAVERLGDYVEQRGGNVRTLRHASASAAAWADTLAELRELDESGPDHVLL